MADYDLSTFKPDFDLSTFKPEAPVDHSKDNSIVRGVKQGYYGLKAQVGGLYEGIADTLGDQERSLASRELRERALADAQALALPTDSLTGIGGVGDALSYAGNKLGNFLPMIAGVAGATVLGSPAAGVAVGAGMGGMSAGDVYAEAKKEGLSDPGLRALGGGAANALMMALPIGKLTSTVGKTVLKDVGETALKEGVEGAAKSVLSPVTKLALKEGAGQAAVQAAVGASMPLVNRLALDKPIDTSEALMEAIESAVPMGIMGGGFGYLHGRGAGKNAVIEAKLEQEKIVAKAQREQQFSEAYAQAQADVAAGAPLKDVDTGNVGPRTQEEAIIQRQVEVEAADNAIAQRIADKKAAAVAEEFAKRVAKAEEELPVLNLKETKTPQDQYKIKQHEDVLKARDEALKIQEAEKAPVVEQMLGESEPPPLGLTPEEYAFTQRVRERERNAAEVSKSVEDAKSAVEAIDVNNRLMDAQRKVAVLEYEAKSRTLSAKEEKALAQYKSEVAAGKQPEPVVETAKAEVAVEPAAKEDMPWLRVREALRRQQEEQALSDPSSIQIKNKVQPGSEKRIATALDITDLQARRDALVKLVPRYEELISGKDRRDFSNTAKLVDYFVKETDALLEKQNGKQPSARETAGVESSGRTADTAEVSTGLGESEVRSTGDAAGNNRSAGVELEPMTPARALTPGMRKMAQAEIAALEAEGRPENAQKIAQLKSFIGEESVNGAEAAKAVESQPAKTPETPEEIAKAFQTDVQNETKATADNPALAAAVASGDKGALLRALREGATPEQKALIVALHNMNIDIPIEMSGKAVPAEAGVVAGQYLSGDKKVVLNLGGMDRNNILHELSHAVTLEKHQQATSVLDSVLSGERAEASLNRAERTQLKDLKTLQDIVADARARAAQQGVEHYGLKSELEFLAEVKSNPEFQAFLKGDPSLWQRFVGYVKSVLGFNGNTTMLDKALSASDPFFKVSEKATPVEKATGAILKDLEVAGTPAQVVRDAQMAQKREAVATLNNERFLRSPKEAADVTDSAGKSFAALGDAADAAAVIAAKAGKLSNTIATKVLSLQSGTSIRDVLSANVEMVKSRVSEHVNNYFSTADTQARVIDSMTRTAANHAADLQRYGRLLNDPRKEAIFLRDVQKVSVESSQNGTNYKLNGRDNLAANPALDSHQVKVADEMHRMFNSFNPEVKKLVTHGSEIMRVADQSKIASLVRNLATVDTTPEGIEFAKATAPLLDIMSRETRYEKTSKGEVARSVEGTAKVMDANLRTVFAAAANLPEGLLKTHMTEMAQIYEAHSKSPYASAGRQGEFFANVGFKNMDEATWKSLQKIADNHGFSLGQYKDQNHIFVRVETADQASGIRDALTRALGEKNDVAKNSDGAVAQIARTTNVSGISTAMRSILETVQSLGDVLGANEAQKASLKAALEKQVMSMIPETATRSAKMKRENVPGYSSDIIASFSSRAQASAHEVGQIYTARMFSESLGGLERSVRDLYATGTAEGKQYAAAVRDEINKRYNNMMQPLDNNPINTLNSMAYSFYLGGSVAYTVRNMMTPYTRGSYIGKTYGNVKAFGAMARAQKDAFVVLNKVIANAFNKGGGGWEGFREVLRGNFDMEGVNLSKSDLAFIAEQADRGNLKLGQAGQLLDAAHPKSQGMTDFMRATSATIMYSEVLNRMAVGLAAHRLAEAGGKVKTPEARMAYAFDAVEHIMDNYQPSNAPSALGKYGVAGKATPLLTMFQSYNLRTMEQLYRTVHDGFFLRPEMLATPEGRLRAKEAKAELGGLLAVTAMIGGPLSLPFANAVAGMYNSIMKDADDPSDIRQSARNMLSDAFGPAGGRLAAHGAIGMLGVDPSTFGMQDLLPGTGFLASRRLLKDRLGDTSKQLIGPAPNMAMNLMIGASKIADGNVSKGIEAMLPSGIKSFWKAQSLASEGYTDAKGMPIGVEVSPWDVGVQALGFRPMDKAERDEAQNFLSTNQALVANRKSVITNHYLRAYNDKDAEGMADAVAEMQEFNKKNPTQPIRGFGDAVRKQAIELAIARSTGTGVGVSSARKMPLLQQIRFARQGGMPE